MFGQHASFWEYDNDELEIVGSFGQAALSNLDPEAVSPRVAGLFLLGFGVVTLGIRFYSTKQLMEALRRSAAMQNAMAAAQQQPGFDNMGQPPPQPATNGATPSGSDPFSALKSL